MADPAIIKGDTQVFAEIHSFPALKNQRTLPA